MTGSQLVPLFGVALWAAVRWAFMPWLFVGGEAIRTVFVRGWIPAKVAVLVQG